MMFNPLAILASLLGRLLNRIAPQPKPRSSAAEKAVVLPFSRQSRSAVVPRGANSHHSREPARLR